MKRIQDITELAGKRVLVRVDYNVPIKDGKIADNERISASLETVNYLVDHDAIVILCSHLGKPNGQVLPELSLALVAEELGSLSKKVVQFVPDCIGSERDSAVAKANNGDIILLENLRFHAEEETNDSLFAQKLARGCDLYINDAFSASHRAHASIVGVAAYLSAYAGFELEREVDNLSGLLYEPAKPFVLISGGAKVSDKIDMLLNLVDKVDVMLIGGGMANTFLSSQRLEVGCSLYEEEFVKEARDISLAAQAKGVRVILPRDVIVTKAIVENARGHVVPVTEVEDMDIIADLGPESVEVFGKEIKRAGTIFWNGPVGVAEFPAFAKATLAIGKAVAESDAFTVIGGGDTIAALPDDLKKKFSFVSMAGGASMEFLEGKELPGLVALEGK
jgi:phosphoglycerate kinase